MHGGEAMPGILAAYRHLQPPCGGSCLVSQLHLLLLSPPLTASLPAPCNARPLQLIRYVKLQNRDDIRVRNESRAK